MSDLEVKIKELERQLALKQAYLSVQVSFPKGNKIPEDVRNQVADELKKACTQLAEDVGTTRETQATDAPSTDGFSEEDKSILKHLINTVKAQIQPKATVVGAGQGLKATIDAKPQVPAEEVHKLARVITLDHIPAAMRARIEPQAEVYVQRIKGDRATVAFKSGQVFTIPLDDLDFNM